MNHSRFQSSTYLETTFFLILVSSMKQYRTGTTSIVSTSIVMPPKEGIAMGTMM